MPDNTTTENKGLLVDPKEAFVELLKLPMEKPTRVQRLTGSPSRIAGLIMLALIWIPSAIHYRNVWQESGWQLPSFGSWGNTSAVVEDPVLVVTHEWSATTYVDTTKTRHSVSDPISAIMEIRDPRNPARVILLDGSEHIPPEWDQIQWRLPDTEHITSAKLTIR